MRLLVVEDDPRLANLIARGLREQAYAVDVTGNGKDAIVQAAVNTYDAMILDVMLPGSDGFTVLREIRSRGIRTPVMMLTARDAVADRITGLDAGADDYLTKPFDFGELLARLRALLRRPESLQPAILRIGDLEINVQAHGVTRAGVAIALTAKEFALLELFMQNTGRVLTRTLITEKIWEASYDLETNLIEVYVRRLRQTFEQRKGEPVIRTIRGSRHQLA